MNSLSKSIVFLFGFYIVNIQASINSTISGQRDLLDIMIRTRDVSNKDPERSMECFNYYVPILNDITAEYKSSYAECLRNADDTRIEVENSFNGNGYCMDSTSKNACLLFTNCSKLIDSINFFECYADEAFRNVETMYYISVNASDVVVEILEQYRLIENEKFRCTNASDRAFVEQTANTYKELQNCLLGIDPVPQSYTVRSSSAAVAINNAFKVPYKVDVRARELNRNDSKQDNVFVKFRPIQVS